MIGRPEYVAAADALERQAALAGVKIEQLENPFLCEDSRTFALRAWLADGREFSMSYEIDSAGMHSFR